MRVRRRGLALTVLAAALALMGGLTIGLGGSANAQTGTATPGATGGGPQNVPAARFFGTVTVNGASLPAGAIVTAMVGTVNCGTGAVTSGNYSVDIQTITGCTGASATIKFTVNGLTAAQTGTLPAVQGTAVQLNLTVAAATPSPTAAPVVTAGPPPPPPPPPARTSAPTVRPTARPTAAPVVVVPTALPRTGDGSLAPQQQKPSGPAVVTAQKPAVPAAAARPATAPALPNTGTGGLLATSPAIVPGLLLLGVVVALLAAAGTVLTLRRS